VERDPPDPGGGRLDRGDVVDRLEGRLADGHGIAADDRLDDHAVGGVVLAAVLRVDALVSMVPLPVHRATDTPVPAGVLAA
jgi:hypothetical protein